MSNWSENFSLFLDTGKPGNEKKDDHEWSYPQTFYPRCQAITINQIPSQNLHMSFDNFCFLRSLYLIWQREDNEPVGCYYIISLTLYPYTTPSESNLLEHDRNCQSERLNYCNTRKPANYTSQPVKAAWLTIRGFFWGSKNGPSLWTRYFEAVTLFNTDGPHSDQGRSFSYFFFNGAFFSSHSFGCLTDIWVERTGQT